MHSINGNVLGFTSKLLKDLQLQPQQVFPIIQNSLTCDRSSHSVLQQEKSQTLSKSPAEMGPAERALIQVQKTQWLGCLRGRRVLKT